MSKCCCQEPQPEYSLAAEQRRQLGLIATNNDRLDRLDRKLDTAIAQGRFNAPILAENPNFGKELVDRFRMAQDTIARKGSHSAEFCVYGNDGYLYSVRVSR